MQSGPALPHRSWLLALLSAAATAQPPQAPITIDSVAPGARPFVRQHAMHTYKMPDGTYWDGWGYFEYRKIVGYALKAFERVEPARAVPGQTLVEDRIVGTIWKIVPGREARAWGLTGYLADEEGLVPKGRFEEADRQGWRDVPPLWSCAEVPDHTWPFAYLDESDPDDFTRVTHGGYLQITRDWGDGRYDFTGYSLDRGHVEGTARVPDARRFVKKDRFKGAFFLWPTGGPGAASGQSWDLIPAEEARVTADQLARAVLSGRAEIAEWRFEIANDRVLWRRTLHPVEAAPEHVAPEPAAKKPPTPAPAGGPDLLILNDGRYFRGRIIRHDAGAVVIRVFIGQSEMDMTFKPDQVKEIQAPEKR